MLQIQGLMLNQINRTSSNTLTKFNDKSSITLKPPLPRQKNKKIKVLRYDYICDERKQNILNGRYIRKKQKLLEITKQNVRLFQKINCQKSVYRHEQLNKSYESNKSDFKSRVSRKSQKSFLIEKKMEKSQKSSRILNEKQKSTFFHRTTSAKKCQQRIYPQKSQNIQSRRIQQTKPEDIKKFACLFNINQEQTLQQRNRPNRIRSSKILRSLTSFHNVSRKTETSSQNLRKNNQIVINEENQIQIHEQIKQEIDAVPSSRAKSASQVKRKVLADKDSNVPLIQRQTGKLNSKILSTVNQQKINLLLLSNQNSQLNSSKGSFKTISLYNQSQKQNGKTSNLQEIKNNQIKDRILIKKLGSERVADKYSNLICRIGEELKKTKRPKQSTLFRYQSRLIA